MTAEHLLDTEASAPAASDASGETPPPGGDYVVCQGGSRHRAWYSAQDWDTTVAAAEQAGETAFVGRTLGYVVTDERRVHPSLPGVVGRVAAWNPSLAGHRRREHPPQVSRRNDPQRCTFLSCTSKPTQQLVPQYGRPWLLCDEHAKPALDAFSYFDNRQGAGSRLEVLA